MGKGHERKRWTSWAPPEDTIKAVPVISGYEKGSTNITVSDASGFSAGDFIVIDQRDDPSLHKPGFSDNCQWLRRWENGFCRGITQILEIKKIEGKKIIFTSPLYWDFSSIFYPEVFGLKTLISKEIIKYAGIEDLYLYRTTEYKGQGYMILMQYAAYCWARNVETFMVSGRSISLRNCYRCVVRDSYFHHAWNYSSGGMAYGICIDERTTDSLIENNMVYMLGNPITFESSGGGNVVGYNYADDAILAYAPWWQKGNITCHCAWPYMELIEGNWVTHVIPDNIHGGSGYLTFFRNYLHGEQLTSWEVQVRNVAAVEIQAQTYFINIVGNILMKPGFKGIYELFDDASDCDTKSVYIIGFYDSCESCDGVDPMVYTTLLRHGNFDYFTNSTVWDPNITDRKLPDSLYLKSKPAFFGDKPWPPIGPDLKPMTTVIPAKERFDAMKDSSPPTAVPVVKDGLSEDIEFTHSQKTLSANWDAAVDPETNVMKYWYAIGTKPGGTDTANWAANGNIRQVTRTGLSLRVGATYYFSVKAENISKVQGSATNSNGQFVKKVNLKDKTPPLKIPAVRDGMVLDRFTTPSTTQLIGNWDESGDDESGIRRYWYAIGTTPGGADTVSWTDNGMETQVRKTGLKLKIDKWYYFTVKAENLAGLKSPETSSDGVFVTGNPVYNKSVRVFPDSYLPLTKLPAVFQMENKKGGEVIIYTLLGRIVRKLTVEPGTDSVEWDGKNRRGRDVYEAVYIYDIVADKGKKTTGRIAIIR
jgi:hypothetical protein